MKLEHNYPLLIIYITLFNRLHMAEPQILQEFNDQKINVPSPSSTEKLPKIQRPSRRQTRSRADAPKTPPNLPSIKPPPLNPAQPEQNGTREGDISQRDDFALQIEQKLKLVLQNVNHGEIEEQRSEGSQELEFQELIEQNKQKLKHQKQMNENRISLQNRQQKKEVKRKSKTIKANTKNDNSAYEKKMKDYRQALQENKYIQRKKQILAQRQEIIDKQIEKSKARAIKEDIPTRPSEKELNQRGFKQYLSHPPNSNVHINKSMPQHKVPRSATKQKPPKNLFKEDAKTLKVQNQDSKTANMFDNIHNLLLNPQKARAASEAKKGASQSIKMLEEKIKSINQKLGQTDSPSPHNESTIQIQRRTALDWKRLEYNRGSNFRCHYDSNFQKQVDRISYLQQKSNDYLLKLVTHQKTLVELALLKKIKPEISTNTN